MMCQCRFIHYNRWITLVGGMLITEKAMHACREEVDDKSLYLPFNSTKKIALKMG